MNIGDLVKFRKSWIVEAFNGLKVKTIVCFLAPFDRADHVRFRMPVQMASVPANMIGLYVYDLSIYSDKSPAILVNGSVYNIKKDALEVVP